EATTRWAGSNTNLGIVLLLAPIARAALVEDQSRRKGDASAEDEIRMTAGSTLRGSVRRVLDATTIEDARDVYAAIRLAAPGGLGTVDKQDAAGEPTHTLVEVMRLAAARDGIAREYAAAFEQTFVTAVPALERGRRDGLSWSDATVETFLTILAASPDTHIARRGGADLAADVT